MLHRPLITVAFLVAEHGVWSARASVVVARGLSSRDSWVLEHRLNSGGARARLLRGLWDLPGSGPNPNLLHWQEDSLPLSHQGSPQMLIFA